MKKLFLILLYCSFAFSQDYLEINLYYSDPQNAQCNSFQKHISSFLNNPYLQSQDIRFKAIYATQSSNTRHYKLGGKCDLVISQIKQNKEVAHKTFVLSSIISRYIFLNFLTDNSELYDGLSPYSFLAWIWKFIFQYGQSFFVPTIILALCYGIASGALYLNFVEKPKFFVSLSILLSSLLIGGLLAFSLTTSINPTKLPPSRFENLSGISAIICFAFLHISIDGKIQSFLSFFITSLFCGIFAANILSIRTSFETISVFCVAFLVSTFLFSKLKSRTFIKIILLIASLLLLSLSVLMIWLFGYFSKTYALCITSILIVTYVTCLHLYNRTNFHTF